MKEQNNTAMSVITKQVTLQALYFIFKLNTKVSHTHVITVITRQFTTQL